MIKVFGLFATSLLFSVGAFAASVDWNVGPVSIQINAKDFQIKAVEVTMTCRISDGSGIFESLPTTSLTTKLTQDTEDSSVYTLDIEGGNVKGFQFFAQLRACSYFIDVYSEQEDGQLLSGRTTLASASDQDEIDQLIQDTSLNEKISKKSPLKLELSENKAVIVEVE